MAALGGRLVCEGGPAFLPGQAGGRVGWERATRRRVGNVGAWLCPACARCCAFDGDPSGALLLVCSHCLPRRDAPSCAQLRRAQVITVNIYRNMHEAFQTFDYLSEHGNFGWVPRQGGGWAHALAAPAAAAAAAVAGGGR
mgnify:CR=1 FL=1